MPALFKPEYLLASLALFVRLFQNIFDNKQSDPSNDFLHTL